MGIRFFHFERGHYSWIPSLVHLIWAIKIWSKEQKPFLFKMLSN
jgi:hypothetical protein